MTDALAYDEAQSATEGQDDSGLLTTDGRAQPARFHPLAQLFPMIEGEAFTALVDDVRENGVRRPVVMFEGMILDGRNRYMAAREAEVGFPVVDFVGADPVTFVISENIHRRHLSDAQRQMVGARLAKLPRGGDQTANGRIAPTAAETASLLNTTVRGIERARVVVEGGAQELVEAVQAGTITVSAAAEVARLPVITQARIVADGPAAVRETAKAIREDATVVDRVKAGASVAEARKPHAAPSNDDAPPVDPERRAIGKLTTEAMIDEIVGLRADLREAKDKKKALKDENADLKAKLAEATTSDMGKALGNAQRRADTATGRMNEHMATAKRLEFKLKKAEARVAELEAMPVSMT